MSTSLFDLDDDYVSCDNDTVRLDPESSPDEILTVLMDFSLPRSQRESLLADLDCKNPMGVMDFVNNVLTAYLEGGTTIVREILEELVENPTLPFNLRLKCSSTIGNREKLFKFLDSVMDVKATMPDFNHTVVFETSLDNCEDKNDAATKILVGIIGDAFLDEGYRYKLLSSAWDRAFDPEDDEEITRRKRVPHELVKELATKFLYTSYKNCIFAAQRLRVQSWLSREDEYYLIDTCDLHKNDSLYVADMCDFLLECKWADIQIAAKTKLMSLEGVSQKNVYSSSQNVHQVQADVEGFLETLSQHEGVDFAVIQSDLAQKRDNGVDRALTRIAMDRTLYSNKAWTLKGMLCKVYGMIQRHNDRDALMQRLVEELHDMSDTCSSGHLLRLINVFTGFEGGITLGVREEITTVVNHRINLLVQKQPEDVVEAIVDALSDGQEDVLMKHLYSQLAQLHDELWTDYKTLIAKQLFTEHFRGVVTKWTTA